MPRQPISALARIVAAILAVSLLTACGSRSFRRPDRMGPPALVLVGDEPHEWLVLKQEEHRESINRFDEFIGKSYYHIELQSHDPLTTARQWKKRLLTLTHEQSGHTAEARLLGQDGQAVWLFLCDQPVALSSADGTQLADRKLLEQRNPSLRGRLSKELAFYAFDEALIITAADGKRYKVHAPDYVAEPYQPASEQAFQNVKFMSTVFNGYRTADFLTRRVTLGDRWLALYSDKEAQDAGNDDFGRKFERPDTIWDEGHDARRTFRTARIGKTREFSEGTHDRIFDLTPAPGTPDFLDAGIMLKQGTRQPLLLADPAGVLVLHRTRLDAEGRLAVTRLDASLHPRWTATLPFLQLSNRAEFPGHLLLCGAVQVTEKGATDWQDFLVALDLTDGRMQAWNVTLERSVTLGK